MLDQDRIDGLAVPANQPTYCTWQYEMLDEETAALTGMTTSAETDLMDKVEFLWNNDPNMGLWLSAASYGSSTRNGAEFRNYVANPAIPLETQRV